MAFINAWFKSIIFTLLCVVNIAYSKLLYLGNTCNQDPKAIAISPIIRKPNPNAIPIEHENQMLVAVVRLVILMSSSLFRISPAPRNPIPVTI